MKRISIVTTLLFAAACNSSGEGQLAVDGPPGSRNVIQGGAQDFALFRKIIDDGEIPTSDVLDDVGFFAEHALDLPAADCGQPVCIHPMLAVAPRFDGGNWTMAFVSMNSAIDPASLPRPSTHIIVVAETSDRTFEAFQPMLRGLQALAETMRETDRITILTFADTVQERVSLGDQQAVRDAIIEASSWQQRGPSALYEGLVRAGEVATSTSTGLAASRIVLLTSGIADRGISSHDRIIGLGESIAARGVPISVVGHGAPYDQRIPLALGELGAGTYSYAEVPHDLYRILQLEGETMLYPIAQELDVTVRAGEGYRIGRIYGVARAETRDNAATLSIPAVFLGHREGAQDIDRGRRGGGGGMFVELIADPDSGLGAGRTAADVSAKYRSTQPHDIQLALSNPLPPGRNPDDMWPYFSDASRGKAFMMLNMYLALKASVEFYEKGDCKHAIGVVDMMGPAIEGWQAEYSDPDINDDAAVMYDLRENLVQKCAGVQPVPPRDFAGGCMFL